MTAAGDRVELGARFHAGHEQHVDAGGLVGLEPRNGVGNPGQRDRGGTADDDEARVLAAGERRAHLADRLIDREQPGLGRAVGRGQQGVLDRETDDARGFQFLHGALDVERIAVAVVGIDQQRQIAGPVDAIGLRGEFGEREQDDVGRTEHRERGDRPGQHAGLEAEILRDARGDRIIDRCRMDAAPAVERGAKALASIGPVHCVPCPA